jgi:hypothetical protein
MSAVVVAIIAGLVAFLTKLGLDELTEHRARSAVAAALSGELGAYLRLIRPEQTIENIKTIAATPYDARIVALRGAFLSLPTGHPVFDRVADKIGTLSPEAARGVSEAYNITTSARLWLGSLSSESFLAAPDNVQVIQITAMVGVFGGEVGGMRQTIDLLDHISRERFIDRLRTRLGLLRTP